MTRKTTGPADDRGKIGASAPSDQSHGEAAPQPHGGPAPAYPGDFDIRIARDGTWFYRDSPIGRKALVRLYSSVLRREANGEFWLVTPAERVRVEVEEAPYTAVELSVIGSGPHQILRFRTNVDDWIEAGPQHPIRVEVAPVSREPRPYVLVKDGLEALILRPVYYRLVELGVERAGEDATALGISLGVWSHKTFFPLGCLD